MDDIPFKAPARTFETMVKVYIADWIIQTGKNEYFPKGERINFCILIRRNYPHLNLSQLNQISKELWEEWEKEKANG